jgi:hypothetical protein
VQSYRRVRRACARTRNDCGGLTPGRETFEVEELWAAALREATPLRTPLDRAWWAKLQAQHAPAPERDLGVRARGDAQVHQPRDHLRVRHEDWGEAPDARGLVGRVTARATLRQWVLTDRCRVIALLGLGGIGKTVLAARLAKEMAADFELVFWRSLRNAPTLSEWFASAIEKSTLIRDSSACADG